MNCVYIIQSEKKLTYYIGSTVDLLERIKDHNAGRGGSYTKKLRPWKLICYRECETIEAARILEKKVKSYKGGNAFKKIINGEVAEWSKAAGC